MKKTITFSIFLATAVGLAALPAQAREKARAATERSIESAMSAPTRSGGGLSFALGLSSITPVPVFGTAAAGASYAPLAGSVTGILQFTSHDALQMFIGFPGTSGAFAFGGGAVYKRTVAGGEGAGFHVGGGFGLGTANLAGNTQFALSIMGLAGIHFGVGGTPVSFHFDAGPSFSMVTVPSVAGANTSNLTSFQMGQYSTQLGASIVYTL